MQYCLLSRDSLRVINYEHLVQQVEELIIHEMSILCLHKSRPLLPLKVLQVRLEVLRHLYVVICLHIAHNLIGAKLLSYPYQLVIVVVPLEEWLLEDHP